MTMLKYLNYLATLIYHGSMYPQDWKTVEALNVQEQDETREHRARPTILQKKKKVIVTKVTIVQKPNEVILTDNIIELSLKCA